MTVLIRLLMSSIIYAVCLTDPQREKRNQNGISSSEPKESSSISKSSGTRSPRPEEGSALPPAGLSICMFFATISVVHLVLPSLSSHERVLIDPSTYTIFPLVKYSPQ